MLYIAHYELSRMFKQCTILCGMSAQFQVKIKLLSECASNSGLEFRDSTVFLFSDQLLLTLKSVLNYLVSHWQRMETSNNN